MITTTLLIIATLLIQSCNKPTEPVKESISITVEDVSCTEAWLKISDTNANPNITVIVKRDNTDILTLNLNKADTVIVDENLLPNKSYTYRAVKQQGSNLIEASKPVTATTLDTTSHNFTWQTFEFGEHSSSVLYDVAIIDENNIWAVGEIYMKDSLGNYDHNAYNAVHWDGQSWKLKKIGNQGGWPCRTVFAFAANDVWFEGTIKWDGDKYTVHKNGWPLLPNGDGWVINKLWGSSSNDLYAVGNGGNIAHWNGSSWKKIESGTSLDIYDIGKVYSSDKFNNLYALACDQNPPYDKKLIRINKNGISHINIEGITWPIRSIWFCSVNKIYAGGSGIYIGSLSNDNKAVLAWINPKFTNYTTSKIRGKSYNDIYVVGHWGAFSHYNGISWRVFEGVETPLFDGKWLSVDVKGDIVCVVGTEGGLLAKIMTGKRVR